MTEETRMESHGSATEAPETEPARQLHFMELAAGLVRERVQGIGRPLTFVVITFGCQMNARDSEKLRGILERIGYLPAESEDADLVIYNTCTVREHANTRLYGRLGSLRSKKREAPDRIIGLCGCMMQEKGVADKIRTSYDFVDLVFGTHNLYKLAELLFTVLSEQRAVCEIWDTRRELVEELPVDRKYPFKSGVNIMYGCNNFCSYCIVPYVRGREVSRPARDILAEIEELIDDGVKEVMLLGQNVNSYGSGDPANPEFPELLARVAETGIPRIRFMTSHPKDLSDALIEVIAAHRNICRHLHLPLQSGSNAVLERMNRRYTRERYLDLVHRLRASVPEISLTTDIIVGFPGETEEDHAQTMDLIEQVRFDSAFTFQYSRRSGTPAAEMADQVDPSVVADRFDRLLALVQRIGREQTARFTGQTKEILVESVNPQVEHFVTGRMDNNIVVHFPGEASLIGAILPVHLESCHGFYYIGRQE